MRWNAAPVVMPPRSHSLIVVGLLSSVVQWQRVRHETTVHAEMMTGLRLVLMNFSSKQSWECDGCQRGSSRWAFVCLCLWRFLQCRGLLALNMLVEVIAPFPTQMHVCLHACLFKWDSPHVVFQSFQFLIRFCCDFFSFRASIVSAECLFVCCSPWFLPSSCLLAGWRVWWGDRLGLTWGI